MDLEVIETLTLSSDGAGGKNGPASHWSRNAARPRYSLNKEEIKERMHTQRFTCFDVAEAVESGYDVLFVGRVSWVYSARDVEVHWLGGFVRNTCRLEHLALTFRKYRRLARRGLNIPLQHKQRSTMNGVVFRITCKQSELLW